MEGVEFTTNFYFLQNVFFWFSTFSQECYYLKTVLAVVLFTKVLGLVKSESPRTLLVLGLSNITSHGTFAKSTTSKTVEIVLR